MNDISFEMVKAVADKYKIPFWLIAKLSMVAEREFEGTLMIDYYKGNPSRRIRKLTKEYANKE